VKLTENALKVLKNRYLRRGEDGKVVETPEELFVRVATAIAAAEADWGGEAAERQWREIFLEALANLDFLPNSPTLMNAGTELGQLSACFVLPVGDTLEEIFDALKAMALVQRTGGGTGFSFSRLRPRGDIVASTGGESSGPVSFMQIFDCATEHIRQGGKRRGANMGILRVDHPDIMEFILAKRQAGVLENFNISVGATATFMEAVRKDKPYDLINPRTGKMTGRLQAREVFHEIVKSAWLTGDPGMIFLDTINDTNPTPALGQIEATNPCGEVPLLAYESCNLGSINLSHMLKHSGRDVEIDWPKLRRITRIGVRFLDDVIEVNRFPLDELARAARGNRKIGLGVMGFAELLIRLGISYASEQAVETGREIMRVIAEEARKMSMELAEERGVFPNYQKSVYFDQGIRLRNATQTSVAPTGTISIIAGTTASIEPLFALAYRRTQVLGGQTLVEVNPVFLEYAKEDGFYSEKLVEEILQRGRISEIEDVPPEARRLFVTALEVDPEQHLAIQQAFQQHVDNAVSKTVNLPREATEEEIAAVYLRAWELGLKGITIYRYGSKGSQVLELGVDEEMYHHEHFATCDPHECRL
jgi:ribonucleoside-diphosphate reductase alpha chain